MSWQTHAEEVYRYVNAAVKSMHTPVLSVIVPVYNVEAYLQDCLDSLARQSLENIEIIIVDDGSPDGSLHIAKKQRLRDRRIKIVRRENGGLGAARNTGVAHARGRYLTFLDSDDEVPRDSYATLVGSLEASGSDVAVGGIYRIRGEKRTYPRWSTALHDRDRLGIKLTQFPQLLRDFYSPNKVYRTSFFTAHGFRFREGVLFEDQPLITQIYCRASAIDVLRAMTYGWRIREDGSSLSQSMHTVPAIAERERAIRLTRTVVERSGQEVIRKAWLATIFQDHIPSYLRASRRLDAESYEGIVRMIAAAADPEEIASLSGVACGNRVMAYLAAAGSRQDFIEFLLKAGPDVRRWPKFQDGEQVRVALPLPNWIGEEASAELTTGNGDEYHLTVRLSLHGWQPDGSLRLAGFASVPLTAHLQSDLQIELVNLETGRRIGAEVFPRAEPQADLTFADRYESHLARGFEATITARAITADATGAEQTQHRYGILFRFRAGGLVLETMAAGRHSVRGGYSGSQRVLGGLRYAVEWERGDFPVVVVHRLANALRGIKADTSGIELRIETIGAKPRAILVGAHSSEAERFLVQGSGNLGTARIPVSILTDAQLGVWVEDTTGRRHLLRFGEKTVIQARRGLLWPCTVGPALQVRLSALRILSATSVAFESDGRLRVGLSSETVPTGELVLTGPGHDPGAVAGRVEVDETELRVALRNEHWDLGTSGALTNGRYRLETAVDGRRRDANGPGDRTLVMPSEGLNLPVEIASGSQRLEVQGDSNGLRFASVSIESKAQRSPFALPAKLAAAASVTVDPSVAFFQCLQGATPTDSQLAIALVLAEREPDRRIIWGTGNTAVRLPAGHERVVRGTVDWYRALGSAGLICVNHELPNDFVKKPGQVIVQTYHGHPFKAMGLARWRAQNLTSWEIERNLELRESWDYLVSPSPVATRLYRECYPVGATMLEVGHPRNDSLIERPEVLRSETRERLDIPRDAKVVLYAPTWRDYATTNPWSSAMVEFLDPLRLSHQLGDDWYVLVRGHHSQKTGQQMYSESERVRNVITYPQVNDLMCASDVGLFDYSSMRFDFLTLQRPMVFFVPDEDAYFEASPGLIDFAQTCPGPMIRDPRDLPAAIKAAHSSPDAGALARARSQFAPWDDGHAAERVVERIADASA